MSSRRRLRHVLVGTLSVGLALSTLSGFSSGASASSDPRFRATTAPEVFYPLAGSRSVVDQKNWSRQRGFTDIKAPCGSAVRASHAGTVTVLSRKVGKTPVKVVRVRTGPNKLWSGSAYLTRATVRSGQRVAPGTQIGVLGRVGKAKSCKLQFKIATGDRTTDASVWLSRYVGTTLAATAPVTTPTPPAPPTTPPSSATSDVDIASFNILGAKHTAGGAKKGYETYPTRFNRTMTLLDERGIDVAGLQEMHRDQSSYMAAQGYTSAWGRFYYDPPGRPAGDPDNTIIWRKSTMEFVKGETFAIPYFKGKMKQMPAVLLREKATGRTAWFLNVHNPASSKSRGDHSRHRARALAIERAKVAQLREQTGRPVFLTGDFNDNEEPVCELTRGRLMVSAHSPTPTDACLVLTRYVSIDWIFGSGDVAYSDYVRDMYPKTVKISDHPIVTTSAELLR